MNVFQGGSGSRSKDMREQHKGSTKAVMTGFQRDVGVLIHEEGILQKLVR